MMSAMLPSKCRPRIRLAVEPAERISLLACFQARMLMTAVSIHASWFTLRAFLSRAPGAVAFGLSRVFTKGFSHAWPR